MSRETKDLHAEDLKRAWAGGRAGCCACSLAQLQRAFYPRHAVWVVEHIARGKITITAARREAQPGAKQGRRAPLLLAEGGGGSPTEGVKKKSNYS
jgi:hypothetical protein